VRVCDKQQQCLMMSTLAVVGTISDLISLFTKKRPDVTGELADLMTVRALCASPFHAHTWIPPVQHGGSFLDSSKARRELGFVDDTTGYQQMRECVEWLQQHKLV
jgi:hypothetical protein